MSIANQKFADYVTSGAFNLSLSRNQISELAMLGSGASTYVNRGESLERRGLIEAVPRVVGVFDDEIGVEYRLTATGLLVVQLLHAAGLTNNGETTLAREVESLRGELGEARRIAAENARRARSLLARLKNLQDWLGRNREFRKGSRIHMRFTPRDSMPDTCTECHGAWFGVEPGEARKAERPSVPLARVSGEPLTEDRPAGAAAPREAEQ